MRLYVACAVLLCMSFKKSKQYGLKQYFGKWW